jgi:hypothetical protein
MKFHINIEAKEGKVRQWSFQRCKNASGNGAIYPLRMTWKEPVTEAQVFAHVIKNWNDENFKGFKHIYLYPTEEQP